MASNNGVFKEIVKAGRIAQWILTGGGVAVCIVGGTQGFLDGAQIVQVILALGMAVFGIESLTNHNNA